MRRIIMPHWFGLIGRASRAFFNSHSISSRTSCICTPGAEMEGLAIKTISQHGSTPSASRRNDSRISRRARLRCTAFPIFLDVIKPIRDDIDAFISSKSPAGSDGAGRRATLRLQRLPAQKLPSRFTRPNSADERRRPSIAKKQGKSNICPARYLLPLVPRLLLATEYTAFQSTFFTWLLATTVSWCRPLARRAFITLRPPLVCMR
jgi:hypothetical protein